MTRSAPIRTTATLLAWLLIAGLAPSASAGCADAPGPGVNWRRCYLDSSDLKGTDLTGAMLRDTTFQRTDLSRAVLTGADAYRAKFLSATLVGTVLDGTRLIETDFTRADLTGARLVGADLRLAKFVDATLVGAILTGALVDRTDFRRADLSGATWIDGTRICAPGSIGRCN